MTHWLVASPSSSDAAGPLVGADGDRGINYGDLAILRTPPNARVNERIGDETAHTVMSTYK